MFDYIPAKQDVLSPTTCRVYKNSDEYSEYLSARFKSPETRIFAFADDFWVFSHSGADDVGMFDVLRRAEESLAAVPPAFPEARDHYQFMRDRTDIPGFFNVTVPMSILRALLPSVLTSDRTVSPRSRRA